MENTAEPEIKVVIATSPASLAGCSFTDRKEIQRMRTRPVTRLFRRFARDNRAVSALEYAILVGVITAGVGAAVATFVDEIEGIITQIGDNVETAQDNQGTP